MDLTPKKVVTSVFVILSLLILEAAGRRGGLRSLRRQRQLRDLSVSTLPKCGVCDETRCPTLNYCEGKAIKDQCSCCTVCSSSAFQPHVAVSIENPCDKVQCPKFKVCTKNIQGVPLCGCPGLFMCRKMKKKKVCGTDGITYESRCHMRIASCNQGLAVRKKYKGECTLADEKEDAHKFQRRMKKKARRDKKKSNTKLSKTKTSKRGGKKNKKGKGKKRQKRRNARSKNRNGKSRRRRHNLNKTFDESSWATWHAEH